VSDGGRVRYAPDLPLPAAAFVPGRAGSVRPERGAFEIQCDPLPPERWRESEAWLRGVDLWNHGFLWEAHECWEQLWRAPFDAVQEQFLRGMIQCAAAGLKLAIGQPANALQLARSGTEKVRFAGSSASPRYMGLEVQSFAAAFQGWIIAAGTSVDETVEIRVG
jgi:hypothetical protein